MIKITKRHLRENKLTEDYIVDRNFIGLPEADKVMASRQFWNNYYAKEDAVIKLTLLHTVVEDFIDKYPVIKKLFTDDGVLANRGTYGVLKTFTPVGHYETECIKLLKALWGAQFSKDRTLPIESKEQEDKVTEVTNANIKYLEKRISAAMSKRYGPDWLEQLNANAEYRPVTPMKIEASAKWNHADDTTITTYNITFLDCFVRRDHEKFHGISAVLMTKTRKGVDKHSYEMTLEEINTGEVPAGVALSVGESVNKIGSIECCDVTARVLAKLSQEILNTRDMEVKEDEANNFLYNIPGLAGFVMLVDADRNQIIVKLNEILSSSYGGQWQGIVTCDHVKNGKFKPPYKLVGLRLTDPTWQKGIGMDTYKLEDPYGIYYYIFNPATMPAGWIPDIDIMRKLKPFEERVYGNVSYKCFDRLPPEINNPKVRRFMQQANLSKIVKRKRPGDIQ